MEVSAAGRPSDWSSWPLFSVPSRKANYYDVLGVAKDAKPVEIQKAYRKMALKYHPAGPHTSESLFPFPFNLSCFVR